MRPWLFIIAGFFFVLLGVTLTADVLKALGPMRRSLESADQLSRHAAELEVIAFRLFSIILGVAALILGFNWRRVCESGWVTSIWAHPAEAAPDFNAKTIITWPFILVVSGAAGFLALLAVGPSLIGEQHVKIWSREDGLGQQLTAFLFILAGILAFVAVRQEGSKWHKFWLGLLSVGFLVCAGEEISWGQRIFDFSTPEQISTINVQNEVNIHNMFGYAADHLFIALVFFYGAILPLVVSLFPFINKLCDRLGLPIASPGLACGFLIVSLMQHWVLQAFIDMPSGFRVAEVRELLSSLGLALLMWEACHRTVPYGSASQMDIGGNAAAPRRKIT
jgi:hypothetical protein